MRFAILVFPGSNCDHDAYHAVRHVLGEEGAFIWHKERSLDGFDAVIIPGASLTVIICGPAPSPAFRPSCRRCRNSPDRENRL